MTNDTRSSRILSEVQQVMEEVSGQDLSSAPPDTSFFDHGLDSLLLTQAALALGKRFGIKLKLRQLAEDFPSTQALAEHLSRVLDPSLFADADATPAAVLPTPAVLSAREAAAVPSTAAAASMLSALGASGATAALPALKLSAGSGAAARETLEAVVRAQLALMARQLELLGGSPASLGAAGALSAAAGLSRAPAAEKIPAAASRATSGVGPEPTPSPTGAASQRPSKPPEAQAKALQETPADPGDTVPRRAHGPQLVIERTQGPALSPTQQKHLSRLIERYAHKTRESKAFTARNREHVADPRTVAGFKPALKELVYPIVVKRSSGCRVWDLDGNEYVDLLSGYGSNFFGFGAPFIREAIAEQMELGMEIGPQTHLVEEVTQLFREFVPFDRVAYCNTGSEAVLATLRMARTVSGKDLVVMFAGGYHGMFDEVIVRPTKKRSMPAAPGIPASAVENMLVLPWADPASLDVIRERADEIAAVLVEPVQSRYPEIQPREFLHEVRRITEERGIAMIMDEVVCGFRIAPGGAQEHFGIRADLASYGKVVGGGLSIGIVAGKREYMDALDGGPWRYGDASVPEVGVTYFAGTFVRHPIAMAAARAALRYMKERGPELQKSLNDKTDRFVARMNQVLRAADAPLELRNFGSVMKFAHLREIPFGEIIFHHLRERGVHVWDGRPSFLTEAHGEQDLDFVVNALRGAVADMQDGEFYPRPITQLRADAPPVAGARLGRDASGAPTWYVPDPEAEGRYKPYVPSP